MTLTEAGATFLLHVREVLRRIDMARDAVDALAADPTGRVAVGVPATLATRLLPPLALTLRQDFPRLKPRFVDDFSAGLHARIHAGELDLALLYAERALDALATQPLLSEPLMLVAKPSRVSDPAELLGATPVVLSARPSRLREIIDRVLADHAIQDQAIVEVDSLPAIVSMVAQGVGCTILPYSTVADEVDRGELGVIPLTPEPTRTLVVARPIDRPASMATRVVETRLRGIVSELAPRFRWTVLSAGPA